MIRFAFSCLPLLCGIVALTGWWFDIAGLERLGTPLVAMNPAAAACVALSGLSLLLIQHGGAFTDGRQRGWLIREGEPLWLVRAVVLLISGIVFCIALLKLGDLTFHTHWNVDRWLFTRRVIAARSHLSPNGVAAYLLVSGAIMLSTARSQTAIAISQVLAFVCSQIAFLVIAGSIYGVKAFYQLGGLGGYKPMALHTSCCIMLLSAAVLLVRHREGLLTCISNAGPAGRMAATMLPASLLVPIGLGWLRVLGQKAHLYSPEFGVSLSVVLNVATLFGLIWLSARRLYAVDLKRQQIQREVQYRAAHDGLTGLANRAVFFDRLQHRIDLMRRRGGPPFAVFYLDLDGFKQINDQLGHEIGDQLLVETARVLQHCSRLTDTVARLGGDEFTILYEEIDAPGDVNILARRILQAFPRAFGPGQGIPVGLSIGVALSRPADAIPEDVLRHADIALYQAKAAGKGSYQIAARPAPVSTDMLVEAG